MLSLARKILHVKLNIIRSVGKSSRNRFLIFINGSPKEADLHRNLQIDFDGQYSKIFPSAPTRWLSLAIPSNCYKWDFR